MWMIIVVFMSLVSSTYAVLVDFDNCLGESVIHSDPLQLQFVPLDVAVTFDLEDPLRPLNITVYGNVSGTDDGSSYPSPSDSKWSNASYTAGKIQDLDRDNNKYSTLLTDVDVLTFTPYSEPSRFCTSLSQGECPLGPVFYANSSNLDALRAFSVQHDMLSSFHFATFASKIRIKSGDAAATVLGCISVDITPDLGSTLKNALAYVPLVILILVGVATITAAIYSPWGTTDPFRWTSNYGRDEDVIRLVTPGFGDCLQYLQFVVLTGALTLKYPGYYQPVVSQAAWSVLMFNQSFLNPGHEQNPVVDGIYSINTTSYGLDRLEQYVGMDAGRDIWPGMMVWLLVIVVAITLVIQLAFAFRWLHREIANIPEEDLRSKNMPFTVGNIVRIVFNFLFLPLISMSFFQLVIAGDSPVYCVVLAVIVILILIAFALWTIRLIASTRPKSYLFDDLTTVLLYGPLYNTFCDDAAAFAVVPIIISFARGVAIGALQPSGIAQIVLLAICEVVFLLTLVAFRPYPPPTSMNFYHTCFSIVRFLTILLSVAFVPSLDVSEAARGWIGYVILFLHALVLVFGFCLNALQTLIEVIARLAGAGGYQGAATRGGLTKVFGMRQLSRRVPRREVGTRQSMGSEAAMLAHSDERMSSQFEGSRPRSLSGSSALLLNRAAASDGRVSAAYESPSAQGTHSRANSSGMYTPTTMGGNATFYGAGYQTAGSNSPKSGPAFSLQQNDPYYRPPRLPRKAVETGSLPKSRGGSAGAQKSVNHGDQDDEIEGPSVSGRATPIPAYIPAPKDDLDFDDSRQPRKDYAVREVDFYYRVRGPPLSHTGTRKLKTGPADPTGPVSSATGWFRNLFNGKTKEKGKGFEVVRSARAPPPGMFVEGESFNEPYRDEPEESAAAGNPRQAPETDQYHDSEGEGNKQPSTAPATLPEVGPVGDIELPSRMGSHRSSQAPSVVLEPAPSIPRRSSKRKGSSGSMDQEMEDVSQQNLPAVAEAVAGESRDTSRHLEPSQDTSTLLQPSSGTGRLPFSANSSPSRDRGFSIASTAPSSTSSHHIGRSASTRTRDRPSSMGYVAQYRARDNIHEAGPDEPSFTSSTAELVDEPIDHTESEH
ncbi:hypothetical protein ASPWEDRAFT_52669 [Aspergillus wentii DTO 134E9]|uniref:ML-like domain-containing protein n=1 Tax=Aspergillus wentii DTO 134E9 TaxID=1073089 RepID=A0A1L9RHN4_ASPWE|nr:uncharacterized protein ASPWEDRAFT_52669 [Aspergillus wentii DTO 134E9]OJJ34449.1 hypothetical protein ASPWEDRAFT_52669 [Aspergillus wentii DTO 134E9]